MRKQRVFGLVACVMGSFAVLIGPVSAADLSNGSQQTCAGLANWHFVNNQTGQADPGTLTATFDVDGSTSVYTVGADKTNRNTQHFNVTTEGDATLITASTDLPGRLVLSDYSCEDDKKDPKK